METSLWKMNTVDVMDDSITDFNLENMATFNSNYNIKKLVLIKNSMLDLYMMYLLLLTNVYMLLYVI